MTCNQSFDQSRKQRRTCATGIVRIRLGIIGVIFACRDSDSECQIYSSRDSDR